MILILSVGLVFGDDAPIQLEESEFGQVDSVDREAPLAPAWIAPDSVRNILQPLPQPQTRQLIDDVMRGSNTDSLHYDVKNQKVFIYTKGTVMYQDKSLEADNMQIDMATNEIFAYGMEVDSTGTGIVTGVTQPVFTDGGTTYTMDTITYNIKSEKAKIKGVATQEGDGWLVGSHVKKMDDNIINIKGGKYTTCDHIDHPHFFLAMTKAKVIPGEKVVTGPAYIVREDVPLYFLGIPEGFFPISSGPRSGLLMPTYGEDGTRGFFLRDMGYYFTLNDYMDLTLLGGLYSGGSWEASASSRYLKKYKYSGNVYLNYSSTKIGEKGDADYTKQNNVSIKWTHSQDTKANPGSSLSASVNFATSGYSKYSATTLDDILSTQTNSSIAYSKSWSGTPFSLSSNLAVSQNSNNESISVTFPTTVFSVSRFYPFKWGDSVGDDKWYEKISMTYTGKMTNSVTTTESEFFTKQTLQDMSNGIQHSLPVSASFNVFNYINFTPSVSYSEYWYIRRDRQEWNPVTNEIDVLDPDYGFYRLYNYSASASASTTIYGMFQAKNKNNPLQAVRHTLTPSVSMSYSPNFSDQKYGFYETVQTDSLGNTKQYSPFTSNAYGVPSSGESLAASFSLSQNLEMKVLSKRDTSGMRKITLIDELKISGSYNFLADSMNLSTIPLSFRTTLFGNFGVNLSVTLDPYRVSPEGVRYNKLFFPGRVTSTGWSFGYTFKSRDDKSRSAINDINSIPPEYSNPFYNDPSNPLDPVLKRQLMADTYYDFSLPWNLGFNYVVSYGVTYTNNGTSGYEPNVTQSLGFNASLTITDKMGMTISSGYDIKSRAFTTSSINMTRDLHCWQMTFSWIPFGYYRSWSFNIGVKSAALSDLKYDKSQSMYENMY
ncbi:MAG: putative LPS assembly protein LptD [Rikenellaceae bacterium]